MHFNYVSDYQLARGKCLAFISKNKTKQEHHLNCLTNFPELVLRTNTADD